MPYAQWALYCIQHFDICVSAGWLNEVQWVLCTTFWSMDMTGVYACLCETVCDVTTVLSHLNNQHDVCTNTHFTNAHNRTDRVAWIYGTAIHTKNHCFFFLLLEVSCKRNHQANCHPRFVHQVWELSAVNRRGKYWSSISRMAHQWDVLRSIPLYLLMIISSRFADSEPSELSAPIFEHVFTARAGPRTALWFKSQLQHCEVNLHVREEGHWRYFFSKLRFDASWLVLFWKTLSRNFAVASFIFWETKPFFCFTRIIHYILTCSPLTSPWPRKMIRMSMVSFFSWHGSYLQHQEVQLISHVCVWVASNPGPHRHRIYDRREEGLGKPSFCFASLPTIG